MKIIKRALVLEGGGVRGAYQAGSYQAFLKSKIKFDAVVGTSIGSLNGAFIAAGLEKELIDLWLNSDMGVILGLDSEFSELILNKKINYKLINGVIGIIKAGGLKTDELRKTLNKYIDENVLKKSKIDYGLVTLRINQLKPIKIFKKDIPNGKLVDYIIASCYLPIFKAEKIIDNSFYVDGGFYDNSPVEMLLDKNFDEIYVVKLGGLGIYKKIMVDNSKLIYIKPSKGLGPTLDIDPKRRKNNISLGYYDTLKALKKVDGYEYNFKIRSIKFYQHLIRKVAKDEIRRVSNFFKTNDVKELVLKSLEYILKKENKDIFTIYKPYKTIKMINKVCNNDYFIYKFIKKLKLI